MTVWDTLLVAASGLAAGALNAVAGGGTLLAFPALLATGMAARTANIVSTIGLVPGYLGGSVAYRRELSGQGPRVRALAATSVVGGIAGAVILLAAPADSFRAVVPYLLLGACALLAAQPRIGRWVAVREAGRAAERAEGRPGGAPVAGRGAGPRTEVSTGLRVAVFAAAVYGSYFGAGLGVLLLAVFGILLVDGMQQLNALKGLLSFLINAVSVIVFAVGGDVDWWATAVLAVTAWVGAAAGVGVARRLSPSLLRSAVVAFGAAVAAVLLVRG